MAAGVPTDQWKKTTDDYLSAAKALFRSMAETGFDPKHAVPLDLDGELLNGSHRTACALALDIAAVPVVPMERRVFAPAWGEAWFISNGMEQTDLARLREDWEKIRTCRKP